MSEDVHTGDGVPENIRQNPEEDLSPDGAQSKPADKVSDKLDFDDLIITGKKTKDQRGGLSRKEYAKLKENEDDDEDQEVDEKYKVLQREIQELKSQFQNKTETDHKLSAENYIKTTLADKGISNTDFNAHYKDSFKEKREALIADGMNPASAVKYALDLVANDAIIAAKVKETEERAKGRRNANLSAISKSSNVDKFSKLPREDYANLYNNLLDEYKKNGESETEAHLKAKSYYTKYNEYWSERGEQAFI